MIVRPDKTTNRKRARALVAVLGAPTGTAIHVIWMVPLMDSASVGDLYGCLVRGEQAQLFTIQSWDWRDGQVNAILEPQAPFEDIVAVLWSTGREPAGLWLEDPQRSDSLPQN